MVAGVQATQASELAEQVLPSTIIKAAFSSKQIADTIKQIGGIESSEEMEGLDLSVQVLEEGFIELALTGGRSCVLLELRWDEESRHVAVSSDDLQATSQSDSIDLLEVDSTHQPRVDIRNTENHYGEWSALAAATDSVTPSHNTVGRGFVLQRALISTCHSPNPWSSPDALPSDFLIGMRHEPS